MSQLEMFDVSPDFRGHRKYRSGIFKTKKELEREMRDFGLNRIYHVLSFGGGTQSAHLLEQHFRGEIHYDYIIFSDTGAEPQFIHEQVSWWRVRQQQVGNLTPFITTHHRSMERGLEEMLMRYILTDYQRFQMPVYCSHIDAETGEVVPAGIMPRQCTVDFKIVPVKQAARRAVMDGLSLNYRQRLPDDIGFIIDIGFSYDEIKRVQRHQSPQFKYMFLAYPLIEENKTTKDSIDFLINNDLPTRRSRCYLCPFNCDDHTIGMDWEEIIRSEPLSFLKACWFDEQLRKVQRGGSKIMRSVPYLHYSRRPLKEVYKMEYTLALTDRYAELMLWIKDWKSFIERKYGEEE
jgi:hypothetical protein